uniref:Protein-tyrosine-phosphatase n=1 Tax=Trichobilharzia regenti TaxID=157069 RepID=A0AA85J369_TRIRE|nr:unnamed protein product [Trichobilharzia regenti]
MKLLFLSSAFLLLVFASILVTSSSSTSSNNHSENKSINYDRNLLSLNAVGAPRKLSLEIACDILRPCIKATWLPPTDVISTNDNTDTGKLLAYNIRYRVIHPVELSEANIHRKKLKNIDDSNATPYPKTIEKNITGLQYTSTPGEHLFGVVYEFTVAAVTENGYGHEAVGQIAMPEAAPSDAPSNFRVVGGDETSVKLAWEPPRLLYQNGIITKYQVRCYIVGSEENHDELKTLTEQTLNLSNLPAGTHACLVRAWTKAGPGPWSDRVQFLIHQKGPSPPSYVQGYWKSPYILTIEWTLPEDKQNVAYIIIHYATQNNPNLWQKYFVKEIMKTSEDLNNLPSNEGYLIRLSSVDSNGNEGQLSDIIKIHPYQHITNLGNNEAEIDINFNKNDGVIYPVKKRQEIEEENYRFSVIDNISNQPEKFTVQNFKCVHKTSNSIIIEWLPPVHLANLLEYQLHITGRSEFFTNSGVFKSVHLGEWQLHHNIDQQIDGSSRPETLNWPLVDLIGDISALDPQHHHQQQQHQKHTHKMEIPDLKPNSQYKVTIRPIYRALISEGTIGAKEGFPVTIICHTEWSAPEYVKPPEILAIYSGPSDPHGATLITEIKVYRVSEENGPIHNYYIIVSPELNPVMSDDSRANSIHSKSSEPLSTINASQYDLKILSQNIDLPSNQAPYLAMARHTLNLFETNQQHTAIVILGSEEMDNFFIQPQSYLHSMGINNNNHSHERLLPNQDLRQTTDIMSDLDDRDVAAANHNDKNNVDTGTYYYNRNSNMYAKAIQVNNKRLFQSTIYRVALRACSQYSDGRQLCSTSQWSERISSILSENVNRLSNLKPLKEKTSSWNLYESSSFTLILIGLAGGLIFFAILSTILGCILRRRKHQLNRRSALESSNQWDAQICRDLSKSIFAADENLSGSNNNSQIKCFASKNDHNNNNHSFINSHPSNYFLNIRTEERSRSPSNSSSGILGINLPRPSTGGLSVGTNIMSPLASSTNQLTISDISPIITRSVHMNSINNSSVEKCESPTRSVNSTTTAEAIVNRPMFNIQSKSGTTSMMENFNQLFRDGTIEIHRMPIPVDQLQEIIYQARSNNYINFQQEFQAIEQISKTRYISAVHSNLDMNKSKNRYPNILAYDRTRVTIQSSNHMNISGSDYINANYIDGYRKQNAFIATQAPLPNTFEDFWTMVWEQNTSVIVMLSKIIEKGQVKCDQYWPTISGTLIFSNLIITHLETTELANYTIRSFELRKESEHRKIWHLQYTSWPDHGVPIYSTVFLMFLRRVGTITPTDCGPIVVHCSSGTGRTGMLQNKHFC